MNRILLCFTLLFIFQFGYSQKVKLKDHDVKVQYINFPEKMLPEDITAYNVSVSASESSLAALGFTKTGIKKSFNIAGYSKVDESVDLTVEVTIDGPVADPTSLDKQDKKNKEGKTWTEYTYSNKCYGTILMKLINNKDASVIDEYTFNESLTKSGSTFRVLKDATADNKKKSKNRIISGRKEVLNELISDAARALSYNHGLNVSKDKVEYKLLKHDKHPEYKDWQDLKPIITEAYAAVTPGSLNNFMELMAPAITMWKDRVDGYSGSDKHQKKLKYACQHNLALTYFWAEQLEEAKTWATKVKGGDYKDKDGKKMLEKIDKLEKQFAKNGETSRHLKIEVDEQIQEKIAAKKEERVALIEAGDIRAFPDFEEKLNVSTDSKVVASTIYNKNGVSTEGYLVYESLSGHPDFRYPRKLRFGYQKDESIGRGTINYSKLDSIMIDGKMFYIDDVRIGSGLMSLKLNNAIIEPIQSFERTDLLYVHPPMAQGKAFGQTSDLESELVVYNREKEEYKPMKALFGFMKAMKNIVKGCTASEAYIDKKDKEEQKVAAWYSEKNRTPSEFVIKTLELYDSCK